MHESNDEDGGEHHVPEYVQMVDKSVDVIDNTDDAAAADSSATKSFNNSTKRNLVTYRPPKDN